MRNYRNSEHLKVIAYYYITPIDVSSDNIKESSGGFIYFSMILLASTLLKEEERKKEREGEEERRQGREIIFNFPVKGRINKLNF